MKGLIFALFIAAWDYGVVNSFHFQAPSQIRSLDCGKLYQSTPVSEAKDSHTKKIEKEDTATLTLAGKVEISSSDLPRISSDKFEAFVAAAENRNLLITAGGKRPLNEIELTPELVEDWKRASEQTGAQLPTENDTVVRVKTSGIKFPGLTLESLAIIGIKDLKDQGNNLYEFVLLGDEQEVSGLPPVVFIFNKLTGADEKDGKKSQSSKSLTTLSYKEVGDNIVFTTEGSLIIQVKFPKLLLKLLPTNKEKAEESGGKSISKVLERDVKTSMDAFEKAYLETFS